MSSESVPKPRFVLCPKCWQLLQESPNFDVYKCGGCGTTLQAKKRKSGAVNSESSSHETDAAPGNASDLEKATSSSSADCSSEGNEGKDQIENSESSREHPVTTQDNGLREKATFSSSRECSLEENIETGQIENGKCNGEKLVTSQDNGLKEKTECSMTGNDGRDQIKTGEYNEEKPAIYQENGLKEKVTSSSIGECSWYGNGERGQIGNGVSNEEQQVTSEENGLRVKITSFSSGECSLDGHGERGQIENGECNEEQPVISRENGLRENATSSSEEYSSDGNSYRGQILNGESDEEHFGPFNLSDIKRHAVSNNGSSNELPHCDIEASAELLAENSEDKANETNLKLKEEELSNGNMPLEEKDASDEKSALVGESLTTQVNGTDKADSKELNNGNLLSHGTEEEFNMGASDEDPKDVKSPLMGANSELDIGGNVSTAEKLRTENFASEKDSISHVSRRELKEGKSDNHASFPENVHRSFDHLKSADTYANTEVNNLILEISSALGDLSKSPTARSSHAYDGSVSSNDVIDELFPGKNFYSFEGGSKKGKGVVNRLLYEDIERQHQSNFPNRKYRVMNESRGNQNEVVDTTRHDHAHWMRTKKDEFPYKMPHHASGWQSGYESGSPSNQMYDELHCSSSYVSPDSVEDPDQEKMKLLRMVYKLQDQLNRNSHANRETNMGNHISTYQSHDFHEGRFYHGYDYPRGDAMYSNGINMHQRQHNFSGIPYSAEPISNAHRVDHPCFSWCSQEQQCSGEFPPYFPYQRGDPYRPHPVRHSRGLSHQSYPSSPQWLTTSKLVPGRETKSCDQRHRTPEMNYTRDKPNVSKRHYRPVVGGAPFVTCHKCLKLLQLPADFLLFKRLCHKLKCGACQEILKFSLQNKSHIVSYVPNAAGPSSSDLDVQNMLTNGINPHSADPVSYSDDYGRSVSKSYSSEGDRVSAAPFHHPHGVAHNNPSISPTTIAAIPSTSKAQVEAETRSALHQLMGYSSPSLVIRGAPSSVEGKETRLNGEY